MRRYETRPKIVMKPPSTAQTMLKFVTARVGIAPLALAKYIGLDEKSNSDNGISESMRSYRPQAQLMLLRFGKRDHLDVLAVLLHSVSMIQFLEYCLVSVKTLNSASAVRRISRGDNFLMHEGLSISYKATQSRVQSERICAKAGELVSTHPPSTINRLPRVINVESNRASSKTPCRYLFQNAVRLTGYLLHAQV